MLYQLITGKNIVLEVIAFNDDFLTELPVLLTICIK